MRLRELRRKMITFEDCNPPSLIMGAIFLLIGIIYWEVTMAKFMTFMGLILIVFPIILAIVRDPKRSRPRSKNGS